jgi:DNA-binding CsgD family transcriptional regulator
VRVLRLSDNNLSDVSFIGNYKRLFWLTIKNNPVKDLSVIGELEYLKDIYLHNLPNVKNLDFLSKLTKLKILSLNLDSTTDFTALNNYKGLTELNVSRSCAYNSNIDYDKIEANNPNVKIDIYEPNSYAVMESSERNKRAFLGGKTYPRNVLSKMVKEYLFKDVSDEELQTALEESLKKLSAQERDIIKMYHKENQSIAQIASILKITIDEVTRLKESAFKKLSHPSYQKSLEKFIKK